MKAPLKRLWRSLRPIVRAPIGRSTYFAPVSLPNGTAAALSNHEHYETWLGELMRVILSFRKGVFIDVGANVGQTLLKVLEADDARPFLGFEPQISSCAGVARFIQDNALHHCRVLPLALADKSGLVELGSRSDDDVSASVVSEYRPSGFHSRRTTVPVSRGDDVLSSLGITEVAAIKVDVEGGELIALKGFSGLLSSTMPPIIFELLPNRLLLTGTELDESTRAFRSSVHKELFEFLSFFGYSVHLVDEGAGTTSDMDRPAPHLTADERRTKNYLALGPADLELWRGITTPALDTE